MNYSIACNYAIKLNNIPQGVDEKNIIFTQYLDYKDLAESGAVYLANLISKSVTNFTRKFVKVEEDTTGNGTLRIDFSCDEEGLDINELLDPYTSDHPGELDVDDSVNIYVPGERDTSIACKIIFTGFGPNDGSKKDPTTNTKVFLKKDAGDVPSNNDRFNNSIVDFDDSAYFGDDFADCGDFDCDFGDVSSDGGNFGAGD